MILFAKKEYHLVVIQTILDRDLALALVITLKKNFMKNDYIWEKKKFLLY